MAPQKWTPAEEAWFAESERGWAPLDEYQATLIRRFYRGEPEQQERGAA